MGIHTIGIVGAGMGGLTLARILQLEAPDLKVIIYERDVDESSRDQGYLLGVDDSGVRVLQHIIPNIQELSCKESSQAFNLVGKQLQMLAKMPFPGAAICRRKLRQSLLEGLSIQWNKKFEQYEETSDGVEIFFQDGTKSPPLDLLVGCDGCRSKIRKQRCDKLTYDPIGITSVMGSIQIQSQNIPVISNLIQNGMTRVFNNRGSSILLMKFIEKHPDEIIWVVTFPFDEEFPMPDSEIPTLEDKEKIHLWTKHHVLSLEYHKELIHAVNSTETQDIQVLRELHAICTLKEENPLRPSSRVTLLGDAAHSMTTHRGKGANTTFEDALELARMIVSEKNNSNWILALDTYEKNMFKRGFYWISESKRASNMITMTGISAVIRNIILRSIGWFLWIKSFWFHQCS